MDDPFKDKRFSHIVSDPQFRKLPRSERKVKIDQRFKAMFTDDKFKLKYAVDKRGRPVEQTQADNLKKYYELTSGSDDESDDEEGSDAEEDDGSEEENDEGQDEKEDDPQSDALDEPNVPDASEDQFAEESASTLESSAPSVPPLDKSSKKDQLRERSKLMDHVHKGRMKEEVVEQLKDLTVDYARGIGTLGSDESSSDESSSEDSEDEVVFHPWGELDNDAAETEEATCRLAACNLDWDRINAKDLFMLFTSFLPPEGFVKSVTIYPSEYGLQRMKEEEMKGPKELFENPKFQEFDDEDFSDKHAEGSQYCMEKLREYQLNRLRYYYAVIAFNNSEAANKIYTDCDGIEYESSATKMDLRFVPDDMDFDQEPKDTCTSMPDVTKYKPRLFVNTALQQGTVRLTWDETDVNRVEFTKKLVGGENINEDDLQTYIAASSDSSDEDGGKSDEDDLPAADKAETSDDPIAKYKALLSSLTNDNKKHKSNLDMEVSWGVGLGDKDSSSEDDVSSAVEETKEVTKKEKMKKKKSHKKDVSGVEDNEDAELQLLLADDAADEGAKAHFNFKDIQKEESRKRKKRKHQKLKKQEQPDDKFEIDVNDSRFSALYTSHHFNIDPADPRFVKTEAADKIIKEKQKRRKLNDKTLDVAVKSDEHKMNPELASLVKSIKGKHSGS